MKKSYYILLTITATAAVLYLLGNWVGRSFGLNRQQVIRNIHEAYGRAADAFEAGQTKDLAAFFRHELDEVDLKRIKFHLDTVSLHGDSIVLKQDLRYFSDYRKLLEQHYTFVCPVNDTQGVHAYIQNLRAGFIGKLLYMFFGTIVALGLLLFAIRKQVDIIRRQDELARMREDFSSAMVHDMKNPISSILIGLKVLRSGKVDSKPEKKEKHFDILEAEAQHLLALANKVLTISKLEHGQLLLDKNWIQLRPMVDELVHTFTAKAEKPITFQVDPSMLFPQINDQLAQTKQLFMIKSLAVTIVVILISSLSTWFLTRKSLAPLRSLSKKISDIQAQNLSVSIDVPESHDEISKLTEAFNQMLVRLNNAFDVQKQFSANAAHELRTPLAVMQTNLEVFSKKKEPSVSEYQTLFSTILEQTNRLSHLASILLDMTGMQRVKRSDTISLAALADEVLCDLAPIADQKQIKLSQSETDCIVTGSYLLLYRAVYNLVENAIKYNHPSGKVTVTLHPGKVILDASSQPHPADCAFIEISDTGIGISPEYQEKIFAPFFRVDKSRSRAMGGAGLGLALVTEIARQHGGQVKVLESNEKGSTIALMLPL